MKFAFIAVALLIYSCHGEKNNVAYLQRPSEKQSELLDSLKANTLWVIYNLSYSDTLVKLSGLPMDPVRTFGEIDYVIDTVMTLGDTTLILLSPYISSQKLTSHDLLRGYSWGLGYIHGSEMPFFYLAEYGLVKWFPTKPYNSLGDIPDRHALSMYSKMHSTSINPWFKHEIDKRIRSN